MFAENIKRSRQRCCNKQYFFFPQSSSPQGYRSFNGRIGYFKMNCSLHYFHWQFSETVSSSLSNCFWSTKEEHAPLKENYFDAAGTAPYLKRLTCKRASNRQWWDEKERGKKSNTFSQTIICFFSLSADKCSYSRGKLSMSFSNLCRKKNLFGSTPASTQEKANSQVLIREQVVSLCCMSQVSHWCHSVKLQRLIWIYSPVKPDMEYP